MANNLGVTTGSDADLKTTDNAGVHTPHHNVEIAGVTPAMGTGNTGSTVPRVAIATNDLAIASVVTAVGGVETAITGGTIDVGTAGIAAPDVVTVQGIASMTPILATLSGSNNIGTVTTVTNLTNLPGVEYETVAASQTAQSLGATGATGDLINGILVIPATTSPGNVLLLDNATSITVFAGGSDSVSNLVPFFIPLGIKSVSGAWKITTGANVSCIGVGDFT